MNKITCLAVLVLLIGCLVLQAHAHAQGAPGAPAGGKGGMMKIIKEKCGSKWPSMDKDMQAAMADAKGDKSKMYGALMQKAPPPFMECVKGLKGAGGGKGNEAFKKCKETKWPKFKDDVQAAMKDVGGDMSKIKGAMMKKAPPAFIECMKAAKGAKA